MRLNISPKLVTLGGIVAVAAASRLMGLPPNVSPVAAIALLGAAKSDNKIQAFLIPLAAMLLSDVGLELAFGYGFHALMPVVYLSFMAITALGLTLRKESGLGRLAIVTVASSLLFFVTTNFGVWAMGSFYPKSFEGLLACYTAALPFLRNTVLGDGLFVGALFGSFALAEKFTFGRATLTSK